MPKQPPHWEMPTAIYLWFGFCFSILSLGLAIQVWGMFR